MKNAVPEPIYLRDYKVPDYLIDEVDLEFYLEEAFTTVKSTLSIRLNPASAEPGLDLVLDGEELSLKSITLNDETLTDDQYRQTNESLTIFNVPTTFRLHIVTQIDPANNTALSGLYQSSGNFCTQCEAEGFRRITYYLDRPDVMARFTTTLVADETRYPILLSNGNLIETEKLSDGKHRAKWVDPFKKPCYLFALVAGDLAFVEDHFVTQSGRRILLRFYVEKGNQDKCAHAVQALKKAMHWDEMKYGREYDLDIYMIVAVSDFNMGAMENKGLNIFNTQYILAKAETATDADYLNIESVIAHEYFHNWTGNRITCRDWFQLSLKEGLTVFRDQSFTQDTTSRAVTRINDVNDLRNGQFIEDAGPLAHPVRPESYVEINNFYTATIYNKGAEVIRMQHTLLGDNHFRKGMDLYFSDYDGQAVTIEDFVKSMEKASLMDLTQFRLWYSQAGTPLLMIEDHYDQDSKTYTLNIQQTCPNTPGQSDKKPFHIPVKFGLLDSSGKELMQGMLELKSSKETFQFEHINSKPIPSLLREFSAPVKLNYTYSDESLECLFKHDTDLFNRWEAGQRLAVNIMLRLIDDYHEKKPLVLPEEYIAGFQHILQHMKKDRLLLAEMLSLPTEKYLGEQMAIIDVDAIHIVREFVLLELAKRLKPFFLEFYKEYNHLDRPYELSMQAIADRQITHASLYFLSLLDDKKINDEIIMTHFQMAMQHNMTDTMAALRCIVNSNMPFRKLALQEFYQKWQNDALVVDKWFVLQATSKLPDTLDRVKQLVTHPAFDFKNPNKVYSLIGGFSHRNPVRFHAENGAGYQFLTESVLTIDSLNPIIAARMVKSFSDWQRFDEPRKILMKQQLELILQQENISKDVRELTSKSLHY